MKQLYSDSYIRTQEAFSFLVSDYDYDLVTSKDENFGFTLEYKRGEIRVYLYYDYRDNVFNFYLVRGAKTKIPNDLDFDNIKFLFDLFVKYDDTLNFDSFQPNEDGY